MAFVDPSIEVRLAHPDQLYIDGRWVDPLTDAVFEVISPSTERVIASVPAAAREDADRAVAAARHAFDDGPWPRLSHAERADYMRKIAAELRRRAPEIAHAWTQQMGILYAYAQYGGAAAARDFEFYADLSTRFTFVEHFEPVAATYAYESNDPGTTLLVREPVGVVVAIAPWNGPLGALSLKVAPALIAGCTVIMKPAPETPLETFILAECAEAAGLPPGVINLVPAGAEVSEHLVRHRDVDKIAFTGSTAVGQRIAGICAQRTARYTLELGGKSAAIVLGDYDVEEAAARLVPTQCMMTGQVCAALTRVIVPRENHDALVSAFVRQMESVRIGDPYDPESQMGPLAIDRQLKRVQGYVDKGISEGAKLSTGGGRYKAAERGYYFEPTVFSDVNNAMTVAREEIFGPVVSIIPCEDEADAVRISNDSIYGLNGSVFTNDIEAAYRVARNMRTGTVGHNGFKVDLNVGFGGFKQSGIGREGGKQGVLAYLESKTIKLDSAPRAL